MSHSFFRTLSGAHCPQNKAQASWSGNLSRSGLNLPFQPYLPLYQQWTQTSSYSDSKHFSVYAKMFLLPGICFHCHLPLEKLSPLTENIPILQGMHFFKAIALLGLQGASFLLHSILNTPLV